MPTDTKNNATKTILNACRLLWTQLVSFALETMIPATNAPKAEERPKTAVSLHQSLLPLRPAILKIRYFLIDDPTTFPWPGARTPPKSAWVFYQSSTCPNEFFRCYSDQPISPDPAEAPLCYGRSSSEKQRHKSS